MVQYNKPQIRTIPIMNQYTICLKRKKQDHVQIYTNVVVQVQVIISFCPICRDLIPSRQNRQRVL